MRKTQFNIKLLSEHITTSIRGLAHRIIDATRSILNKTISMLYANIDKMYEFSGYRINREFYKKITLYMVYTVYSLLPIFFIVLPLSILRVPFSSTILASIIIILSLMSAVWGTLYMNAFMLINRRRTHFDEKFIYTLSSMIPLVATRASLIEVLSRLYHFERDPEIKHELYLILRDCALGIDPLTALRRSIDRVPSLVYRDVMSSFIEGLKISQCPVDILINKLEVLLERKRLTLRRIITELTLFFQSYIILGLFLPAVAIAIYVPFTALSSVAPLLKMQIIPPIGNIVGVSLLFAVAWSPPLSALFYILFSSILSRL